MSGGNEWEWSGRYDVVIKLWEYRDGSDDCGHAFGFFFKAACMWEGEGGLKSSYRPQKGVNEVGDVNELLTLPVFP